MKLKPIFLPLLAAFIISCNNENSKEQPTAAAENKLPQVKEEAVTYKSDTTTHNGFVAYDENKEGKRPVVFVVHEWWGLNDYVKSRANQLAQMGYFAFAVDMYGNGKQGNNPEEAQALAMPFYQNPALIKTKLDAAMAKAKDFPQADLSNAAAIGYCYGGFCVLNAAKQGSDLKGVVSFHGNLGGVTPDRSKLKANILVCHGAADPFVPQQEVDGFKKQMDSIGAQYTFKAYPEATHAFSNPNATEKGKQFGLPIAYNAAADSASWNDMKAFFGQIFK